MTRSDDLESLRQASAHRSGNAFLIDDNRPEIPTWFDRKKFDAGREFFRQHILSIAFGYLCSLYVGFTVDSLAGAVTYTGESDTPEKSRRRYLGTMGHIFSWHTCDIVCDKSSIGYRSIRYVRNWHDRIRRRMAANDPKNDYITQYEMALVQTGFIGSVTLYPQHFGIRCEKEETDLANYVYFWRVVGYILGLDDDVNACGKGLEPTKRLAKQVEQEVIVPALCHPTERYVRLSNSLVSGFQRLWPWLSGEVIRGFIYPLAGLPEPKNMTWRDMLVVRLLKVHFFLMYVLPWYCAYWNGKVFWLFMHFLPKAVIP